MVCASITWLFAAFVSFLPVFSVADRPQERQFSRFLQCEAFCFVIIEIKQCLLKRYLFGFLILACLCVPLSSTAQEQRPDAHWNGTTAGSPGVACASMAVNGVFSHAEKIEDNPYFENSIAYECHWSSFWDNPDGGTYGTVILGGGAACASGATNTGSNCQTVCASSQTGAGCTSQPVQSSCQSTGRNPIDFIDGKKYRREPILSIGTVFPIQLIYFYNSQAGLEKTLNGLRPGLNAPNTYVGESSPHMTVTEYFNTQGLDIVSGEIYSKPRGNSDRYWRHNYEDNIEISGVKKIWHKSNGNDVSFDANGHSVVYPNVTLVANAGGWKITSTGSRREHNFDAEGRLTSIKDLSNNQTHTVTYRANGLDVDRVEHSLGDYVKFSYETKDIDPQNVSRHVLIEQSYPTNIQDNTGLNVDITWGKQFLGRLQQYHLITAISHPYTDTVSGKRDYEYNNANYPAALTEIYDQKTEDVNTRQPYASFQYDVEGRAIYSSLANGVEAISVNYTNDLSRTVTNSLDKSTIYRFVMDNGVKRLVSVVGEPTASCLQSDLSLIYDADGRVAQRTQNGQIISFLYNDRGLEISRTEAVGTPEMRTITTQWHAQFNLPTKIIEPERIVDFTYDASGKVLTHTLSAPAQN